MDKKITFRAYGCALREIETRDGIVIEFVPLDMRGRVRDPQKIACVIQGGYGNYYCENIDCRKPKKCKSVTEDGWVKCKCEAEGGNASDTQPV
jgi:hypothetical protein